MSENMDNKKLDFDFSDIQGATKSIGEENIITKKVEQVNTKERADLTGIVLAFPVNKQEWILKDIAESDPEEFLRWAKDYYPDVSASADRFYSVSNKIRAFNQIVTYHDSCYNRKKVTFH